MIMIGLWRLSRTDFVVKQSKMNIGNDVVKMTETKRQLNRRLKAEAQAQRLTQMQAMSPLRGTPRRGGNAGATPNRNLFPRL